MPEQHVRYSNRYKGYLKAAKALVLKPIQEKAEKKAERILDRERRRVLATFCCDEYSPGYYVARNRSNRRLLTAERKANAILRSAGVGWRYDWAAPDGRCLVSRLIT